MYNYDSLGRIVNAVLPTGETVLLSSQLSKKDELEVYITLPVHPNNVDMHRVGVSMQDSTVIIKDG